MANYLSTNSSTMTVPHTKEFLIQCQAQNNTFQCALDQTFRDLECQRKDLALQYVTSTISSPRLGKLSLFLRICLQ